MNIKLPHWLQLAITLASIVIAWLMNQAAAGQLVLPATALTVLSVFKLVLGMLSTSILPDANARAVKRAAAAITTSVMIGCLLLGCTKAEGTAVATVTVDSTVCVLNHFSDPPATIAVECGIVAVEDVVKILDAGNAMATRKAAGKTSVTP